VRNINATFTWEPGECFFEFAQLSNAQPSFAFVLMVTFHSMHGIVLANDITIDRKETRDDA
jgi:hypothetical protein